MLSRHILPVLFAASGLAAKFERFKDTSCQNYQKEYKLVTAKQQEDLVLQGYPTSKEEKLFWPYTEECPPNKDGTYRYVSSLYTIVKFFFLLWRKDDLHLGADVTQVHVPQWSDEGSPYGDAGIAGGIMVVYYDDTDTYLACKYMSSVQSNGYLGFCK